MAAQTKSENMSAQATSESCDSFDPTRLARVILPKRGEPRDVRSLYIVEDEQSTAGRVTALSRTSCTIPGGTEISFETYFNAFPASYWRRWSQLDEVQLRVELTGDARVDIYRSKIDGSRIAVTGDVVETDESGRGTAEFTISWLLSKTVGGFGSTSPVNPQSPFTRPAGMPPRRLRGKFLFPTPPCPTPRPAKLPGTPRAMFSPWLNRG